MRIALVALTLALLLPARLFASPEWPNEPSGFSAITDCPFSGTICNINANYGVGTNAYVNFGNAPLSPTSVFDTYLAAGSTTGSGQWSLGLNGASELYMGTWWSTNPDFMGWISGTNKMLFFFRFGVDNNFIVWQGGVGAPKTIKFYMQATYDNNHLSGSHGICYTCGDGTGWLDPNVGNGTVAAGSGWHKIELYLKASSTKTSRDGIVRWWLDGNLVGNYPGANVTPVANGGFEVFEINHTWDGTQPCSSGVRDCSKRWDHFWDHLRISSGSGGGGIITPPPPPPIVPPPPPPIVPPPLPPSGPTNLRFGSVAPVSPTLATDGSMLLHKSATNGRYFAKANNTPQYLVGAYEWNALVDSGSSSVAADNADFLINNGQNFVRWFSLGESTGGNTEPVSAPTEYARSGTAGAGDGGNKWDLNTFSVGNLTTPNKDSSDFFERLRGRALYYRSRGIYVMVDLWSSWLWENNVREPGVNYWVRHPYNSANNINSVNADVNADGHGYELGLTGNAQWTRQQAKIRQFVDALKDVDNVIWSPCNECYDGTNQNQWQADIMNYIRSYETSSGSMAHPILMGALQNLNNTPLTSSTADATSIGGASLDSSPTLMTGSKPNIFDDDHVTPCASSATAPWKAFMRGHAGNLILTCNGKNNPSAGEAAGILRQKQILTYANRINLATVIPTSNTGECSTGYCLIGPNDVMAYHPTGGSITTNQLQAGTWSVEWMRMSDGAVTTAASITSTGVGDSKTITNPYGVETALLLHR